MGLQDQAGLGELKEEAIQHLEHQSVCVYVYNSPFFVQLCQSILKKLVLRPRREEVPAAILFPYSSSRHFLPILHFFPIRLNALCIKKLGQDERGGLAKMKEALFREA